MSSITDSLYQEAWDDFIPLNTTLELTVSCNLRCVHCYNFDRSKPAPKEIKANPLNPKEIYQIIDELAELGGFYLSFTGGEIMLHPHLLDFIRYAKAKNFWVKLKSNATLLTEKKVAELVAAGAKDIDVSLYGGNALTHDQFTTVMGSFADTVTGIEHAKKGGLKPTISYILHKENCHELSRMLSNAQDWGVKCFVSTELTGRYDDTISSTDYRVTRAQYTQLLQGPHAHLFNTANEEGAVQCACARTNMGVSSNGDIYPCIGAPITSGNIRSQSLTQIWHESAELNKIRNLKLDDFKTCKPCPSRKYCQRSSGGVYVDTGNYTGPEVHTCMEADLRREDAEAKSNPLSSSAQKTPVLPAAPTRDFQPVPHQNVSKP